MIRLQRCAPLAIATTLLLASALVWGETASAQINATPENPQYMDFDSGDLKYRTHSYVSLIGQSVPAMYFVPDQGFSADIYVATGDLQPGWVQAVNSHGWNGFATDWVGCGRTLPTPDNDLVVLTDKAIYGVFQMGVASAADLIVAQGLGSAFVIKARAMDERIKGPAVLIDPIGPKGAQPTPEITAKQILARRENLADHLWVEWGIGPEPGKMYDSIDLTQEDFDRLVARYETDQPAYWAAVFTGFEGGLEVREPMRLKDWPVLVVRTPRRSTEQIEREDAVVAWLEARGALVDRLDLADLENASVTGLPMAGRDADFVLSEFVDWVMRTAPPPPRG